LAPEQAGVWIGKQKPTGCRDAFLESRIKNQTGIEEPFLLWACHSALTEKPGVSHAGLQEH
jgi:hypothetical protein